MKETAAKLLFLNLARMGAAARYVYMSNVLAWTLAKQIRAMRQRKGWSQAALARAAGLSVLTIFRLERLPWIIWPAISTLTKIAAALDVALIVRFAAWSEFCRFVVGGVLHGLNSRTLCPPTLAEEIASGDF